MTETFVETLLLITFGFDFRSKEGLFCAFCQSMGEEAVP